MNRLGLLCVILYFGGCGPSFEEVNVVTKGPRKLGIHVTESESKDFEASFLTAKKAGMDVYPLTFYWTTLEAGPNSIDLTLPAVANAFFPYHKTSISLNISPVAAIEKSLPADISHLPFNDPVVISRFKQLLDKLHTALPDVILNNLLIGNEVDLYLSDSDILWQQYAEFYQSVSAYARSLWGNELLIGVECTWEAHLNRKEKVLNLNQWSDYVAITYYPLQSDFTMKTPASVHEDLEKIMENYSGQKVFLEETGYASSQACGSTETQQAAYIEALFQFWDRHVYDLIFVGFLWLHDLNNADTQLFTTQYGMSGTESETVFSEYLRTCGLIGNDDVVKPAYETFQMNAKLRGW